MHICPARHAIPQPPQLALSLLVRAQYGLPPSGWHSVSLGPQAARH
jgi:hypothetical protein